MQMSEGTLKKKIKDSELIKDKIYYAAVLTVRAAMVVVVAVLFVSILSAIFGEDNSSFAVVLLVMILTLRFIHFNYCIRDTLITFAVVMLIFLFVPSLALIAPSWSLFFIHFIAMFFLLCITTQRPEMGLGGLLGFSYCYLVGNAVEGTDLALRAGCAVVGYIIIAAIMFYEHRKKDRDVKLTQLLKKHGHSNPVTLWQIRLALGIALVLTLGEVLNIPNFKWMAFAASSILAVYPFSRDTSKRFGARIEGAAIGSTLFLILCNLIPESMYSLIGLISGFVLGFCTDYRSKTIVICFGALSTAVGVYGVTNASMLRVTDNVLGALFAMFFAWLFHVLFAQWLLPKEKKDEEGKIPSKAA